MKFKKEDLGLYFALVLVGGGAGLLIGALLAARLASSKPLYIPEEEDEEAWENDDIEEEWDEDAEESAPKIARREKSEKQILSHYQKKHFITEEEAAAKEALLAAFIVEFQPSAIQIEMVKNDLLTMDELKEVLILEEVTRQREPYNYNAKYLEVEDKPDLEDLAQLPDEIEVIEERWQISSEQTTGKSKKNLRKVFYDSEDDSFFTMSRQDHPIPVGSVNDFIPNGVWAVVAPYLLSDMGPIFVNDLETPKHFKFEIVSGSEDTEDSSADNAVD